MLENAIDVKILCNAITFLCHNNYYLTFVFHSLIKNGGKANRMEGEFRVTHKCTINDLDELGDTSFTHGSGSFGNPVYFLEPPRVPKPQPAPVENEHSSEVTDVNVTGENSAQANGGKEGKADGVQS